MTADQDLADVLDAIDALTNKLAVIEEDLAIVRRNLHASSGSFTRSIKAIHTRIDDLRSRGDSHRDKQNKYIAAVDGRVQQTVDNVANQASQLNALSSLAHDAKWGLGDAQR